MNSMVSDSLRTWFIKYLRFLVEYSAVIRIFFHVFKEGYAVLNLGFNVVKLPRLRPVLRPSLVVLVSKSQLVFIFNPTDIASIVLSRPLNAISSNRFVFSLSLRRRLGYILMVLEGSLLEVRPARVSFARGTV
jgi:hypothetical protein